MKPNFVLLNLRLRGLNVELVCADMFCIGLKLACDGSNDCRNGEDKGQFCPTPAPIAGPGPPTYVQ